MGSLIKILEGPKEELIDVDVIAFITLLMIVASFSAACNRIWAGYRHDLSMEYDRHRGMERLRPRFRRIGRKS
jgi:hypothetical protein